MKSCNGQIKQSITYEELGRAAEKSRIMGAYDNTPMMLDKFAKRGEVTKSMVMEESAQQQGHGYQPSLFQGAGQPMLASIIMQYSMQEIQEYDGDDGS